MVILPTLIVCGMMAAPMDVNAQQTTSCCPIESSEAQRDSSSIPDYPSEEDGKKLPCKICPCEYQSDFMNLDSISMVNSKSEDLNFVLFLSVSLELLNETTFDISQSQNLISDSLVIPGTPAFIRNCVFLI